MPDPTLGERISAKAGEVETLEAGLAAKRAELAALVAKAEAEADDGGAAAKKKLF